MKYCMLWYVSTWGASAETIRASVCCCVWGDPRLLSRRRRSATKLFRTGWQRAMLPQRRLSSSMAPVPHLGPKLHRREEAMQIFKIFKLVFTSIQFDTVRTRKSCNQLLHYEVPLFIQLLHSPVRSSDDIPLSSSLFSLCYGHNVSVNNEVIYW